MSPTQPEVFLVAPVPRSASAEAYAFHTSVANDNPHIWPRTLDQIRQFAEDGELFGVWNKDKAQLVALVYSTLDSKTNPPQWEIGGLTVSPSVQRKGLGTTLVRFALAHTFVNQTPWSNGQEVVAHVHEANNDPRGLLGRLGFEHYQTIKVPAGVAPASMKVNSEGKLVGDELRFSRGGLRDLATWIRGDISKTSDNSGRIEYDFGSTTLAAVQQDLEEMV